MIAMIDNYDSFTYNLVQYMAELGADVRVFRNDKITVNGLRDLNPSGIVISPGPGGPSLPVFPWKPFGSARENTLVGGVFGAPVHRHGFGGSIVSAKN